MQKIVEYNLWQGCVTGSEDVGMEFVGVERNRLYLYFLL